MAKVYGARKDGNRDFMLTFDDGPVGKTTGPLLDTLAANNISAMFFVVGQLLKSSEGKALVKRMHAEGHVVGNHSFTHPNLRGLSKDKVRDELKRTNDLICECAGSCAYFQPPYGASGATISEVLQELGYSEVLWNVDTLDWKLKTNGAWVDHAMDQIKVREDCIVLMHDIHKSTVDNVGSLIGRIKKIPGHRFTLY